jgi:hypothetical protein
MRLANGVFLFEQSMDCISHMTIQVKVKRQTLVILLLASFLWSCQGKQLSPHTEPTLTPQTEAMLVPNVTASTEPSFETATAIPISSPTTTTAPLQLEMVQSQIWTDRDGHVRANILLLNPYDFPVKPVSRARVSLLDLGGEFIRDDALYFLDGISDGNGFVLPGEMIAANACFTCEREPLTEEWDSVNFRLNVEDANESWNIFTEVEATVGGVSFQGDSPIFDDSGSLKNNSDSMLSRISARVYVFDQEDKLVGAEEASAWDVGPGATASFSEYGIGQAP